MIVFTAKKHSLGIFSYIKGIFKIFVFTAKDPQLRLVWRVLGFTEHPHLAVLVFVPNPLQPLVLQTSWSAENIRFVVVEFTLFSLLPVRQRLAVMVETYPSFFLICFLSISPSFSSVVY